MRVAGETQAARDRLASWRAVDPTSSFLRYEATRLGAADEALWAHLAADPERILEIAVDYMRFGLLRRSRRRCSRGRTPRARASSASPACRSPEAYPLIAYYRGFCRYALGQDGAADYAAASADADDLRVPAPARVDHGADATPSLADPDDATAHFLLGSL